MKKVKVSIIGIIDDRGRKFKISGLFDTDANTFYYFLIGRRESSTTQAAILADSLFLSGTSRRELMNFYFLFVEPIRPV